jgi:hypothetical protein
MGLIHDNPDLAALALARAGEESEGPGTPEGRMLEYWDGLEQRNGTVPFKSLGELARAIGAELI